VPQLNSHERGDWMGLEMRGPWPPLLVRFGGRIADAAAGRAPPPRAYRRRAGHTRRDVFRRVDPGQPV